MSLDAGGDRHRSRCLDSVLPHLGRAHVWSAGDDRRDLSASPDALVLTSVGFPPLRSLQRGNPFRDRHLGREVASKKGLRVSGEHAYDLII